MDIADMVVSERRNYSSIAMGKETKTPRNYRLGSLAMKIIKAEMEDRAKASPKSKKPTETSIVEEAILKAAAKDPKRRELLLQEIKKDPEYSFLLQLLSDVKNDTSV